MLIGMASSGRRSSDRHRHANCWLAALPASCARKDDVTACLVDSYNKRIALLAGLLALQEPAKPHGDGYRHVFKTISKTLDFELQLLAPCERDPDQASGSCEAPGGAESLIKAVA